MADELRKAAQDFADSVDGYENDLPLSAIRAKGALRAALAKNANAAPEQEPVGEVVEYIFGKHEGIRFSVFPAGYSLPIGTKLYTHPMPAPAAPEPQPDTWDGAEEWERLAFELCADEHGEESCNELIWSDFEPWGERWLKYEDEAKRMISLVRKHIAPVAAPQREWAELDDDEVTEIADRCIDIFGLADLISEALRAKNEEKNHG